MTIGMKDMRFKTRFNSISGVHRLKQAIEMGWGEATGRKDTSPIFDGKKHCFPFKIVPKKKINHGVSP